MEGMLSKRSDNRSSSQKRWFTVDSRNLYAFKDGMAAFPLEKIPLGSATAGWQVAEEEEGGGYQFVFKTPYSDGKYCLEADNKNDKNKWMEVLNRLLTTVSSPLFFSRSLHN